MINEIIQGSALERLKELESESVDCCITSPPYWALRDYKIEGQLGLEPTFTEYIAKLIEIFNEVKRVLKPAGSCWVNMGDTYAGQGGTYTNPSLKISQEHKDNMMGGLRIKNSGPNLVPDKSLCGIPQRFMLAMLDHGWICRNTVIWHKPNCMPSSAKDRFTVDFEYLFFFTKSQRYYFDTQYEEALNEPTPRIGRKDLGTNAPPDTRKVNHFLWQFKDQERLWGNSLGRIKRCVWKIPTAPFADAHFAVFPPELVLTPLKSTCPEYICKKCGRAREKIIEWSVPHQPSEPIDGDQTKWDDYDSDVGAGSRRIARGNAALRNHLRSLGIKDDNIPKTFKGWNECDWQYRI